MDLVSKSRHRGTEAPPCQTRAGISPHSCRGATSWHGRCRRAGSVRLTQNYPDQKHLRKTILKPAARCLTPPKHLLFSDAAQCSTDCCAHTTCQGSSTGTEPPVGSSSGTRPGAPPAEGRTWGPRLGMLGKRGRFTTSG